jgi:hypothetical protein
LTSFHTLKSFNSTLKPNTCNVQIPKPSNFNKNIKTSQDLYYHKTRISHHQIKNPESKSPKIQSKPTTSIKPKTPKIHIFITLNMDLVQSNSKPR